MKTLRTLAVITLVVFALGCGGPEKLDSIPADLLGVWRADDPEYADRYLELRVKELVFGTGEGSELTYAVLDIHRTEEPSRLLYTVSYLGEDADRQTLSFYYDTAQGSIRLQNQATRIWWRIKVGS